MQVYVQGKSKKAINTELANGKTLVAFVFDMFNQEQIPFSKDGGIENGTVVKVFEKYVNGNPYAKSYGQFKNGKIV